jgi:hypothetical protein
VHSFGFQPSAFLHPPDPIIRNGKSPFLLEVQPRKDDGGNGEEAQEQGGDADLKLFAHAKTPQNARKDSFYLRFQLFTSLAIPRCKHNMNLRMAALKNRKCRTIN